MAAACSVSFPFVVGFFSGGKGTATGLLSEVTDWETPRRRGPFSAGMLLDDRRWTETGATLGVRAPLSDERRTLDDGGSDGRVLPAREYRAEASDGGGRDMTMVSNDQTTRKKAISRKLTNIFDELTRLRRRQEQRM